MRKYNLLFRVLILSFLLIIKAGCIVAQGLFEKPMNRPVKYLKPTVQTQLNTAVAHDLTPQFWYVWTDREGVVTSNGKSTSFLEQFLVVDEKEDRVHIVKDNGSFDQLSGKFDKLQQPVDYGWVLKDHLILWSSALYSAETNFRIKVLTITDISMMSQREEQIMRGEKLMEYYNSPTTSKANELETKLFEVFYVYKRLGNRSLVGVKESLLKNSQHTIHGWVDNNMIQIWGHRQTLEPSKDRDAVLERKSKNVKASVFADKSDAKAYISNPSAVSTAFWNNDQFEKGYDTYWKRLPILSSQDGVIETAVISDLIAVGERDGKLEIDTIDAAEYEKLQKLYNEQTTRTSSINMVFVIDGTRSMAAPIASVRDAVISTANSLQESLNKFQFGAVIYRDYENAQDDRCFESLRLGDYSSFYRFMNGIRTDDPKCFNSTVSEGMYKGLIKAGRLFRGKERETNVIVLVGDAGDREAPWRVGDSEVLEMMVSNGVSLITIQAHNYADPAYEDFIYQAHGLSINTAERLTQIQLETYGERNLSGLTTRPHFRQSKMGNRTLFNLESSPVAGGLQYAPKKQEIHPDIIKSEVRRIIHEIDSSNIALLNNLTMLINSYGESGFTREAIQMLINARFPKEFIELLSKTRYQFLIKGYTSHSVDHLDRSVYDFILFVDGEELNDLILTLNELTNPMVDASGRRESLYNAFMQILVVNYGVTIDDVKHLPIAKIMELITGLESTSELLKRYTLDDIRDPITMDEGELDGVIEYIKTKRDRLLRIVPDKNYYFISNLRPYYWLSQDVLP
jgi:hypothetical protein